MVTLIKRHWLHLGSRSNQHHPSKPELWPRSGSRGWEAGGQGCPERLGKSRLEWNVGGHGTHWERASPKIISNLFPRIRVFCKLLHFVGNPPNHHPNVGRFETGTQLTVVVRTKGPTIGNAQDPAGQVDPCWFRDPVRKINIDKNWSIPRKCKRTQS